MISENLLVYTIFSTKFITQTRKISLHGHVKFIILFLAQSLLHGHVKFHYTNT